LAAFSAGGANYRPGWYRCDTSVHVAARGGDCAVLKVILENEESSAGQISFEMMKTTPLHLAIIGGHEDAVRLILCYKPDIEVEDGDGHTPLVASLRRMVPASFWQNGTTHLQITMRSYAKVIYDLPSSITCLLLSQGANVNTPSIADDLTILHMACLNGLVSVVSQLLRGGAKINAISRAGLTPLHCAVFALQVEVVIALLSQGAILTIRSIEGRTACDTAYAMTYSVAFTRPVDPLARRERCLDALNACEEAMDMTSSEAIRHFERGAWLGGRFPFRICSRYLRKDTHAALVKWALSGNLDAEALYAALYAGSGTGLQCHLARMRYLGGPTGCHHGLRPIRTRIVSYLAHVRTVRLMVRDNLFEGWDDWRFSKKQRVLPSTCS
jgi:hypothetical protein